MQKISILSLLLLVTLCSSFELRGSSYYDSLFDDWGAAYRIASHFEIPFNSTLGSNATFSLNTLPNPVVFNDLDIDWSVLPESAFSAPIGSYPICVAYNMPLLNDTLRITSELLVQGLTNSSKTFNNDPDLVALNPGIVKIGSFFKAVLNDDPDTINQYIIDYLFKDLNTSQQQKKGSWNGLISNRHTLSKGYTKVVSTFSVSTNSIAFVPLPLFNAIAATNSNIKLGYLIKDGKELRCTDPPQISIQKSLGSVSIGKVQETPDSWPLHVVGHFLYNQNPVETEGTEGPEGTAGSDNLSDGSCESLLKDLRFLYWSFNNMDVVGITTVRKGYHALDSDNLEITINHLLESKCSGKNLLVYDNLSKEDRSVFMICFSVIMAVIFCMMIVSRYLLLGQAVKGQGIRGAFHSIILVVGICIFLACAVIWWFAPSETWVCQTRFWLMGLSLTCVVSSVFMYGFVLHAGYAAKNIGAVNIKNSANMMFLACSVVFVFEIALLIVWTFASESHSEEIVVDPILWQSRYICKETSIAMEMVQYCYLCVIVIFGCIVINKLWKKKMPEDSRWMLGTLYSELLIFILLMVMINLAEFSDETLYTIKVPCYIIAIGNITGAWFVPQLFKRIRNVISDVTEKSSNSSSVGMTSISRQFSSTEVHNV